MTKTETEALWYRTEREAKIRGWDFSPIAGQMHEDTAFPWDYRCVIRDYVGPRDRILDMDTGGGEFLLSLGHDPALVSAVEGYPPNVSLCRETLVPLGIDFRECADPARLPFENETFDAVLNRHGSFDPGEIWRVLKPGGYFLTQQVGDDNDRDLVRLLLPDAEKPYPGMSLGPQKQAFLDVGFTMCRTGEAFRHMDFFTVESLVWFACVIPWEFTGFSVEKCLDRLWATREILEREGKIRGTTHRYLLAVRKGENKDEEKNRC